MVVPVLVEPLWACRELHCQHLKGKLSLQNWQISCSHNCRWTGAQLDARKIFGSPPCLWIIQSQLQRKPYERQQENRDFCRVLRRLIWLRTKDAYWRCSVVTFLESLSNIPIQLFWSPSYNVLNLTMDFERNLLTAEHYFQLYQLNAGWPLLLLGGQAGLFFCIYTHIHYYSFIYTLAAILPIFCKKHRALFPSRLSWQHWPAFKDHAGVKAVASAVSRTASIWPLYPEETLWETAKISWRWQRTEAANLIEDEGCLVFGKSIPFSAQLTKGLLLRQFEQGA